MKILILGSGGREHAFAWKLAQSPKVSHIFVAPGNAGTAQVADNVDIPATDFLAIEKFVAEKNIDYIVVGPEAPLVEGVFDFFRNHKVKVIGPSKAAAQLEGSKDFAKAFMYRHNIPTARYKSFRKENLEEAFKFLDELESPYVLKASGLAAGKGVVILDDLQQAKNELQHMFSGKFGHAGDVVVIEEFLDGVELSVFVYTDGKDYKILPTSKDYKRIGEGDKGLNTGGMGAISPMPLATDVFMQKIEQKIIKPTIGGLSEENLFYRGFLYFGLMKVGDEPYVIEYNVRMGDPETQVVLPRIESDLFDLFEASFKGKLNDVMLKITDNAAATVVMASGGYPGKYEKGKEITGLDNVTESIVFHAGTTQRNGKIYTNGGRVLAVTSLAPNLAEALEKSYRSIEKISFEKAYYRGDIGYEFVKLP